MSEKPVPPALPTIEQVPRELRNLKRWCGWKAVLDEGKWRKPPHSPVTGEPIGAVEKWADHWLTFDNALAGAIKHKLDGVGFVFAEGDGYVGVDFDDCRKDSENHKTVDSWLKWLPTYAEISPSGTGVHAIGKGTIKKALTATALPDAGDAKVEIYNQGRYFTFTGQRISKQFEIGDFQLGVDKLLQYLGGDQVGRIGTEQSGVRPMSILTARRIHKDNLNALRNAMQGEGNALLNASAFFAARAFAAKALEQTEEQLKAEILKIVCEEWDKPHPEHGARGTIESGWASGIEQPLKIIEGENEAVVELIEKFNEQFYVVEDFGNRCRVCWESPEEGVKGKSIKLGNQSFVDFRHRFNNQLIQVGVGPKGEDDKIYKSKGDVWLENRHRNQYEQVVFQPNLITSSKIRNLWRGFAFEPKKGVNHRRYLDHVLQNVCRGDRAKYDYILGWMAYAVRHSNEPGHVALVVQGKKGVGKNVFAEGFAELWGSHHMILTGEHSIATNFNAHLRDKCVIVADEVFFAGDPRQDRLIKGMVTGKDLTIEAKGVDKVTAPNFLHFIIIGNDERLVNVTDDERRYFVTTCGDRHKDDHAYFAALSKDLGHGGYGNLLYHLLYEVDLSRFNVRAVPKTAELVGSMADGLKPVEKAWYELLQLGKLPAATVIDPNGFAHLRTEDFIAWAAEYNNYWKFNAQQVGNFLDGNPRMEIKGMGFGKDRNGKVGRFWLVPKLSDARSKWNELRFHVDWPKDDQGDLLEDEPWLNMEL